MRLSTLALAAAVVLGGTAGPHTVLADQARGHAAAGQRAPVVDRRHGGYRGDYGHDYGHRHGRYHDRRHGHWHHGHHDRPRHRHGHRHHHHHGHRHSHRYYDDPWYGIHLFLGHH